METKEKSKKKHFNIYTIIRDAINGIEQKKQGAGNLYEALGLRSEGSGSSKVKDIREIKEKIKKADTDSEE